MSVLQKLLFCCGHNHALKNNYDTELNSDRITLLYVIAKEVMARFGFMSPACIISKMVRMTIRMGGAPEPKQ